MNTKLFYGSHTGRTAEIANKISTLTNIPSYDISRCSKDDLEGCDFLILGSSTWDDGMLQDDWREFIDEHSDIDLSGKSVAIFGLGDQRGHGYHYCDGIAALYEFALSHGAKVIGSYFDEDYFFEESRAYVDGRLLGLGLDEDYQSELSQSRIESWLKALGLL